MSRSTAFRKSPRPTIAAGRGALAAALLLGLTVAASAETACGVPPSGLVRLWAGIGCQGQSEDFVTSGLVSGFPAYSISNGTGQWIAVTDSADPSQANHTLLIQNGCYYGDLSQFHWQNGQSWVGNIHAITVLPPGTDPHAYPASGDKVIGQCS
jgi:hypothetical protein